MNPNDLATRYHLLNRSFKKTMIYHIGIDAGFVILKILAPLLELSYLCER